LRLSFYNKREDAQKVEILLIFRQAQDDNMLFFRLSH